MLRGFLGVAGAAMAASAANAQGFVRDVGPFELRAIAAVAVQGAVLEDPDTGESREDGDADASIVANLEWVSPSGVAWGFRGELDTADRGAEDLQRDEVYVYVSGGFGRFELGEQDGAADVISYHAPQVGLGQVRGDHSRYAGGVALLSPLDTGDALKVNYLSPPVGGLRFGVSYAPTFESNTSATDPRDSTRQDNAVEVGVAYQTLFGDWAAGVSAAYVTADSDPITLREDLETWSVGGELAKGSLRVGGAYVYRGDSNRIGAGFDQDEINVGAAWERERWSLAASAAVLEAVDRKEELFGVGGTFNLTEHVVLRGDVVALQEQRDGRADRDGWVSLAEISYVF